MCFGAAQYATPLRRDSIESLTYADDTRLRISDKSKNAAALRFITTINLGSAFISSIRTRIKEIQRESAVTHTHTTKRKMC